MESKCHKIVFPVSDEGPKDGSPAQQSDDLQSIIEAHDSCVEAGITPIGFTDNHLDGQT